MEVQKEVAVFCVCVPMYVFDSPFSFGTFVAELTVSRTVHHVLWFACCTARAFVVCADGLFFSLPQRTDRSLKASADKASEDIDYKIRHVEHKVKNRDMVLDTIENRLARLESQGKSDQ